MQFRWTRSACRSRPRVPLAYTSRSASPCSSVPYTSCPPRLFLVPVLFALHAVAAVVPSALQMGLVQPGQSDRPELEKLFGGRSRGLRWPRLSSLEEEFSHF